MLALGHSYPVRVVKPMNKFPKAESAASVVGLFRAADTVAHDVPRSVDQPTSTMLLVTGIGLPVSVLNAPPHGTVTAVPVVPDVVTLPAVLLLTAVSPVAAHEAKAASEVGTGCCAEFWPVLL